MEMTCAVCRKKFESKAADKDPKLAKNKAFCSEFCWFNNTTGSHE